MNFGVDPVFVYLALSALALLFASAALAKLRDLPHFRAVLEAYQVMPRWLVPLFAVVLPFSELTVAFSLLVTQFRLAASISAAVLLLIYGTGIGLNLARGRREIDCGCEGFGQRRPIAGWMVIRNVLLISVAALAGSTPDARAIGLTDALTLAAGLAVFVLLYFAADQLLSPGRAA